MCDTLLQQRAGTSRYAAGFDAAVLSASQAAQVVEAATAIERMAGVIKAKAAARVAECRVWKGAGDRSAASHLARSTGDSVGQAAEALATARRLKTCCAGRGGAIGCAVFLPDRRHRRRRAVAPPPGWRSTTEWTGPRAT